MSKDQKTRVIKYVTSFLLGGGLAYLYLALRDFPSEDAVENYRMLADATTVPGILFIMSGALVWASSLGALDGVSFALGKVFRSLIPGARLREDEKYADFVERRREKAKKSSGYGFLFITGAVFMAVSLFFSLMFYR